MSYFDNKSEIIGIELTSYGKYLLSKGKFKPQYYAFFDDEIIYDSRFSQLSESQNEIQDRILKQTPTLKPQVNFTSVENRATKPIDIITNNIIALKSQENQLNIEKKYALSSPIGKSSYNSSFYPAWNVTVINGELKESYPYIDNTNNNQTTLQPLYKIPQLNLSESLIHVRIDKNEIYEENNFFELTEPYQSGSDFYYYSYLEKNYLFDISELNVDDIKENFDIEVFIEEEKILPGSNVPVKDWRQLMFAKSLVYIKNNILLDEPENINAISMAIDSTFAEHYIKILVDQEIELTPKQIAKLGIYTPIAGSGGSNPPFGKVDC